MTTVAYKDGVLATDSLAVSYYKDQAPAVKIIESDHGWYAFSGCLVDFDPIVRLHNDIIESGEAEPIKWPRIEHCTINAGSAVLYVPFSPEKDLSYTLVIDNFGSMRIEENRSFVSYGSGSPFAMGAMCAGASAEEAVRVASKLDPNTNDDVNIVNIGEVYQSEETATISQAVVEDFLKTQSKKQTAANLGMTKKEVKAHLKSVAEALSAE